MKKRLFILTLLLILGIYLFLFMGLNPESYEYALSRRIPKVLAMLITGASIAYASLSFQTVTENRILTPSVLGLDAVFIFLQTLMAFFLGSTVLTGFGKQFSFLGRVLLMVLFSVGILGTLLKKLRGNIYLLLLVGIILGTLFRSGSSFLQVIIDPNEFLILQGKLFASFNNMDTEVLLMGSVLLMLSLALAMTDLRDMDVLILGRDHAINLGVSYEKLVYKTLFIVAILISVSTALVGPITFLGILVTNVSRELLKTYKHRELFLGATLIGGIALIYGQLLVERVFTFSAPISVLINFVGGVYFIYLLLREGKL